MKKQTFIEIQRAGQVHTSHAQATENQCGTRGQEFYYYEFRIGVTNPSLDCRGFLVDHNDVHKKIIEECSRKIPSCELVVMGLAECISTTLDEMGVKHDYVFMRISTGPFTSEGQGMKAMVYSNAAGKQIVHKIMNVYEANS